jgi:hypothetical protein
VDNYREKYEVLLLVMLRAKIPCQPEHIQALDKNRLIKIPEKKTCRPDTGEIRVELRNKAFNVLKQHSEFIVKINSLYSGKPAIAQNYYDS